MNQRKKENKRIVIKRLEEAGIKVSDTKKSPKNGTYSGIVGKKRGKIKINA